MSTITDLSTGIGEHDRRRLGEDPLLEEGINLLSQDNFDQLLARFATSLLHRGHLSAAAVINIEASGGSAAFSRRPCEPLDGAALTQIDEATIKGLLGQLAIAHGAEPLYLKGVTSLVIGDIPFGCVLFGQFGPGSVLVAWRRTQGDPTGLAEDFLAHQAQEVYRWQQQLAHAQQLIYKDDLTGVFNYRYLEVAMDSEIRRAQRFQMNFALLFIDLDNFKPINDRYGHLSGSLVLKQVAAILTDGLREIDSVFRYGGDEYVVMLLGAGSASGYLAAERIRGRLAAHPFVAEGGDVVHVTASIGVAAYPEHGTEREALIRIADQCMYRSKHGGKNRVVVMEAGGAGARDVSMTERIEHRRRRP